MGRNMRQQFASKSSWLKAADLQGHEVRVRINGVTEADFDDGAKPAILFENKEKGMVLNNTNGLVLCDAFGDDAEGWIGKEVFLYPDKTNFKGEMVDCLRLRVPPKESAAETDDPSF